MYKEPSRRVSVPRPSAPPPKQDQAGTRHTDTHAQRERERERERERTTATRAHLSTAHVRTHTHTHTQRERERDRQTDRQTCAGARTGRVVVPVPLIALARRETQ
jgi:hypothetical protein